MALRQIAAAGAARRASHGGCLQASFEDGEYSATDLDSPPLLTINAPIGLNLRNEPEQIINRSVVQNNAEETIGLEVSPRNNLTLVGGEINLEGGHLTATGGRIELGGLSQAGTVTFNGDGSLSFPTDVARADVTLSNAAVVGVRGTGEGNVSINARNLKLEAGELGESVIGVVISEDSTDPGAQAGDITINATDNVTVDNSIIINEVYFEEGFGGDVTITTNTLSLTDGGLVDTSSFGQGNAGEVNIEAGSISLDGNAGISSITFSGNGGIIDLSVTSTLTLNNDSYILAYAASEADGAQLSIDAKFIVAFANGINNIIAIAEQGSGGNIDINAESILGIQEGPFLGTSNDIYASSEVSGLDGTVDISTMDTKLPSNIIVGSQQTTEQACQSNREAAAKNGLDIVGKGGVPPAPELPLNSLNTTIEGEYTDSIAATPQPIETSQGKIQPARGIEVTPSGVIRLTAYRTNASDRRPEIKQNCG